MDDLYNVINEGAVAVKGTGAIESVRDSALSHENLKRDREGRTATCKQDEAV